MEIQMLRESSVVRSAELSVVLHAGASLERYEQLMLDLVARGDPDLHRRATDAMQVLYADCASHRRLSVIRDELSSSHAEVLLSLLKANLLGAEGQRRLRDAVSRNQEISERLRAQIAHILSTRRA